MKTCTIEVRRLSGQRTHTGCVEVLPRWDRGWLWLPFVSVVTTMCACSGVPDSWAPQGSSVHGIFRREYCIGLPFPTPAGLPGPGTEPPSPVSPALASRFFTIEPHRKPLLTIIYIIIFWKKTISHQCFLPAKSLAPASTLEWGLIFKVCCYHYHRPLWTPLATALIANGMRKTTCHLRVDFFFFKGAQPCLVSLFIPVTIGCF